MDHFCKIFSLCKEYSVGYLKCWFAGHCGKDIVYKGYFEVREDMHDGIVVVECQELDNH